MFSKYNIKYKQFYCLTQLTDLENCSMDQFAWPCDYLTGMQFCLCVTVWLAVWHAILSLRDRVTTWSACNFVSVSLFFSILRWTSSVQFLRKCWHHDLCWGPLWPFSPASRRGHDAKEHHAPFYVVPWDENTSRAPGCSCHTLWRNDPYKSREDYNFSDKQMFRAVTIPCNRSFVNFEINSPATFFLGCKMYLNSFGQSASTCVVRYAVQH